MDRRWLDSGALMARPLTDDEVFGPAAPVALSDDEVFGPAAPVAAVGTNFTNATISAVEEPNLLEEIVGTMRSSYLRGRQGLEQVIDRLIPDALRPQQVDPATGGLQTRDQALFQDTVRIAQQNRAIDAATVESEATRRANEEIAAAGKSGSWTESAKALLRNPRATGLTIAGSMAQALPALAGAAAAAPAGPLAVAGAAGLGGGATEFGGSIMDKLNEAALDPSDPVAIAAIMGDERAMAEIEQRAARRAAIIGTADAVTGGLAGRLLAGAKPAVSSQIGRAFGEGGLQVVGGAAGEGGAQAATGEFDPAAILQEALAEGPTALVEAPANLRHAREAAARRIDVRNDPDTSIDVRPSTPPASPDPLPRQEATAAPAAPDADPLDAVLAPVLQAAQAAASAPPAPAAATPAPEAPAARGVEEAPRPQPSPAPPVDVPPMVPAEPDAAPPPDRLEQLRARRRAGEQLAPEELAELVDLQERDARTARLAGTGRRLDGVRTMEAEREAPEGTRRAFLDLDNFKSINDTIGHGAGDEVIAQVATLLSSRFPDAVFHKGGDEFVVHGVNDGELSAALEEVRSTLQAATIEATGADGETRIIPGVGMSYGIGANIHEAETGLQNDKRARLAAGQRHERRATPRGDDARNEGAGDVAPAPAGEPVVARAAEEVAPAADDTPDPPVEIRYGKRRADSALAARTATPVDDAPTAGDKAPAAPDAGQPTDPAPTARAAEPPAPAAPAPPAEPAPERAPTGTKNAVTDAERAAEGRSERELEAPRSNEDTLAAAREELADNPARGREAVERLKNAGVAGLTLADEAVLMAHKVDLRAKRDAAGDRATDESASEEARAVARREWDALEAELNDLDQAAYNGGREWGRFGQFRQRMLNDDFSFAALERKRRVLEGRPLTAEESAEVRAAAARAEELEAVLVETRRKLEEAEVKLGARAAFEQLLRELAAPQPAGAKPKPLGEALKQAADAARERLRKRAGQLNSGVDPAALADVATVGAWHVYNGARKFADWIERMRADLGAKLFGAVEHVLPDMHKAALAAAAESPKAAAREIDPDNITHRDVYNLARKHVQAGVKDEDAVMKAVHADLLELRPDITERDVRRLFSDYGKATFPSKAADKAALRELRALVQLQESIDRLKEGLLALKSGPQRDKATQAIREKRMQLNELLKAATAKQGRTPEQLATLEQARITNLQNQIEDLTKALETGVVPAKGKPAEKSAEVKHLERVRDDLKRQLDAITKGPKPSPEQQYQRNRAKSIQRQIDEIKARIARNDYSRAVRVPKELDAANQKAAFELAKFKAEYARRQFKIEMEKRPKWRKALGGTAEAMNLGRALMTSVDLSGLMRQGGFVAYHPVRFAKAFAKMLQAASSEARQHAINEELLSRQNARLYKRAGLELTDPHSHDLTKMEEAYMSRWLDKLPNGWKGSLIGAGIGFVNAGPVGAAVGAVAGTKLGSLTRASQRAYSTVLNVLRADTFDAMYEGLVRRGGDAADPAELKAIGKFINVATGRGNIGKSDAAAVTLNTVFFAPRLVASRFQLVLAPFTGMLMFGGSGKVRKMIATEYARYLTGVAAVYTLAALFNDDEEDEAIVSLDPRSTNFGKIRFGERTFLDPLSGLAQVTTFMARMLTGEKETVKGDLRAIAPKYTLGGARNTLADLLPQELEPEGLRTPELKEPGFGQDTADIVLWRFLRTKFSPVFGALVNIRTGTDVVGNPTTASEEAVKLVTPMVTRDIYDIMVDNGVPKGTVITVLTVLGMSSQYRAPIEEREKD